MKFNIDDYPGNYVMHLKTQEEAEDFSRVLDKAGKKWKSGSKYTEWCGWTGNDTIYYFNEGYRGSFLVAKDYGYKILEWSDFMDKKFTKADLKDGDICVLRNGWVGIVNCGATMYVLKDGWNVCFKRRLE